MPVLWHASCIKGAELAARVPILPGKMLVREQPLAGETSPQVHGGIKARETSLAKGLAERWSFRQSLFVKFRKRDRQ
ncbi:MAG: hypothetical protein CFE30_08335 [Bradyrhizobium sp. PARBB1]|nr:MAG: hypothetical protein CFE30_08335 [Bradyrhizobium sp. PARBB1]PSO22185.1 hypothetical protein C7G43_27905 [Bradyrhizobium sp. MOS004]HAQ81014.1 hypothetical protein [Bradyrhizobium sp.]HAR18881.1 hypothetical protein [Bradyrhizobium sp.]HAR24677.1 hypothetical protein [Bradyrhizobium sp.]